MLRYAAEHKEVDEPLCDFVKRRGGINECAERFGRHLGRGSVHRAALYRSATSLVRPHRFPIDRNAHLRRARPGSGKPHNK